MARLLDEVSAISRDPWDLLQRITAESEIDPDTAGTEVLFPVCARALAYFPINDPARYGSVAMGRKFSSSGGDWPPSFSDVPLWEKTLWSDLADATSHPLVKTHMQDLALSGGSRSGRAEAETITRGYIAVATTMNEIDAFYRATILRRAWTISRQYALPVENEIRAHLYKLAQEAAPHADILPGVLFCALEPLAIEPRSGDFENPSRDDVRHLMDNVEGGFGQSTIIAEAVLEIREKVAETPDERLAARRSLVCHYLRLADSESAAFARMNLLQEAAKLAQRYGLNEIRNDAIARLQKNSLNDFQFESVSTDIVMPRYALDGRLARYRRTIGVFDALELLFTSAAPTGVHAENKSQAAKLAGGAILSHVTRTVVSADGMPLSTSSGPESAADEWLEKIENINASFSGMALVNELSAIRGEHGEATGTQIGIHLAAKFGCDLELSSRLGESIVSFWDGRFGDAARQSFPIVEAAMRGVLMFLGEPIFRIETGEASGRFPSLETYLERLEAHHLDPDWGRTIKNPVSVLRNSLAHGMNLSPSDRDAALLIRVAGLFVLLCPADSSTISRSNVAENLRDPLGAVAGRAGLRKGWRRVWVVPGRRRLPWRGTVRN